MTLETLADIGPEFHTPRLSVEVGDETFEETSGLFTEVSVDQTIDGADRFSLSVASRFDLESSTFVDMDWETFEVGESVSIAMGYGPKLPRVLDGKITEQSVDFPAGGPPTIGVSGYGRYHDLTTDVVREQWEGRTDGEIARGLADAYGLEPAVDDTPIEYEKVENEKDSDAEFLEERLAQRNDEGTGPFETFVRLDELVFRAPRDDRDPSLELIYGESLQSFSPELVEAQTPETVEVRNWDPRRKGDIVGTAESEDGSGKRVVRRPVESQAEAERIASAILHRARNQRLRGSGTTIGLPGLDVGEPIELSGLGERFSGTYYVEEVTHTIGSGGYTTDFSAREAREGVLA